MKKDKPHQDKTAKKQLKEAVQKKITEALKKITAELKGSVDIDIEKESKKLAKKIIKHADLSTESVKQASQSGPVADSVKALLKPTAKASAPKAAKPVAAKPVKTPAPKKAEAKPVAKPAVVVKAPAKNGAVKVAATKATKK